MGGAVFSFVPFLFFLFSGGRRGVPLKSTELLAPQDGARLFVQMDAPPV